MGEEEGLERRSPIVRTFELPGFFNHVRLVEKRVGRRMVFHVPSPWDMHVINRNIRPEILEAGDKRHGSNHFESVKNAVAWVERGIRHLEKADEFLKKGEIDSIVRSQIDEAVQHFEMAQNISQTLKQRYFPGADEPEPLNSILS